jgi:hypothetical protein
MPAVPDVLARAIDLEADEDEVHFARTTLVPATAAIAATAIGFGVARACCGVDIRKADPKGILPMAMAACTAGVALWSYFNPQPNHMKPDRRERK